MGRAGLERWLNRVWYHAARPPLLLRMLEPAYRRVAAYQVRRNKRRQPADLSGMPIIVVGNITVGAINYFGENTFDTFYTEGEYHGVLGTDIDFRVSAQYTRQRMRAG